MDTKKLCATCKSMKFDEPVNLSFQKKPMWLKKTNFVLDFIRDQKEFRIKRQKKDTMKVSVQLSTENAGLYVLYWAATSNDNNLKTREAKAAYDHFQNSGISRVNKDGRLDMFIQCPQNYKTVHDNDEYTFYRHVHFVLQKEGMHEWDTSHILTFAVTCEITLGYLKSILRDKTFMIVNAIGSEFDIPDAIHLDTTKSISSLKRQLVVALQSYPKIKRAIETNQIDWYAIPMVVYCKNRMCPMSKQKVLDLYHKGFVNVSIFPEGFDKMKQNKMG